MTKQTIMVFESETCGSCKAFEKDVIANWDASISIQKTYESTPPSNIELKEAVWATPTIVMVEDNKSLINFYSIMPVSRNKCPNVKENDSNRFISWLLSEKGRLKISEFKIDGKKLFYVDK